MIINRNFKNFKFQHRSKKNQIIYTSKKVKNDDEVLNLINNFLEEKNSFIFESVEKGKIKGRYTIFGKNPDKIWEFNNNNSYLIQKNKKIKLKDKPENLIDNFLEEKNSFIFESVEKGKIKGRYTIFGKNPDKIWEFNNQNSFFSSITIYNDSIIINIPNLIWIKTYYCISPSNRTFFN